jgi:mannose-1-phosphate guanylyltransferase
MTASTDNKIDRAMILAAGLGTRLRPLTLHTPKPLLPLDGTVLIDHQLRYLARSGIKSVAINLHHLGDKIRDHVDGGDRYGLEVNYSDEPEILGTGGGIKKAARFFGRKPFVVINADALIAADVQALIRAHLKSGAQVTMAVKRIDGDEGYTPIDVSDENSVTGFGHGEFFYTGLQVLGPEIFDMLPPSGTQACLIEDGYKRLLERGGRIGAFVYKGYFNDMGTPGRYEQAKVDVSNGKFKLFAQ